MKNLVKLGKVLNKAEQKQVKGGGPNRLIHKPDPCISHEECGHRHGNYNYRCDSYGRCHLR